ncbi:Ribosomal RNA small subunit methyltransferase H [Choanephora cucurbitarum]|uniref:Ribosomal RNA small subunit methyltransferase H n=1 Tax=Choanephora cucurbitarum TaxID=101091 RepID=A0A1C7N134_9FUNG|nr:Ribosomal RNA small subunit methyltransferase H [Choanephora cucurbitarum]
MFSILRRTYSTVRLPYEKIHVPVLLPEVISHLSPKDGGVYCDMTFGDGGYTKALLDSCDCKVVAIDQDPTAYAKAKQLADLTDYKGRLFPVLGKFGSILDHLEQLDWQTPCFDGIMMDIGVSSGQIETPERGFSYKLDGPLDMRMFSRGRFGEAQDEDERRLLRKSISAYEIVNFFSREQIADIIYRYGGDRLSRKIAAAIVTARQTGPIETTASLATIIQTACPQPRWQRGHDDMVRNSAARTFQAFRIYINNELDELERALAATEYLLRPHGRLAVVTFHSLEDRIVKNFMQHCAGKRTLQDAEQNQFSLKRAATREYRKALKHGFSDINHKGSIPEQIQLTPSFEICTKHVIQPTEEELDLNARSRSAKLRVAERTMAPPLDPFNS